MIRYILLLILAALALIGCVSPGHSSIGLLKEELDDIGHDYAQKFMGTFVDYTTAIETSLDKEPDQVLIRKPTAGIITSKFGIRKLKRERRARSHNGIDFRGAIGTPIWAAGAGKVIFSGWRGAYGQAVEIDHGNGLTTLYAHMSKRLAKVGQEVRPGTVIGKIGNTGRSTGPHLHFEVRVQQKPINPLDFVKWASS